MCHCGKDHPENKHGFVMRAFALEALCRQLSERALKENWCEVCFGSHQTWVCCLRCKYDMHICTICGDFLGHEGLSACEIVKNANIAPSTLRLVK